MALGHINPGIGSQGIKSAFGGNPYSKPRPAMGVRTPPPPPEGFTYGKHQIASVNPATGLTQWNPQLIQSKQKSSGINFAPPGVPSFNMPNNINSTIDVSGMMQQYLPPDVVQRATNSRVADMQQAASPQRMLEQMGGGMGASASSGQAMARIPPMMQPTMQQTAMLQGQSPIEAGLQRYKFGTQALGVQARDIFGQNDLAMDVERSKLRDYGRSLNDYNTRFNQRLQLANML